MTDIEEIDYVKLGMCFWLRRWRDNPLAYVLECLGEVPTHQQASVLKAFCHHRFVAVRSGHGIGKSKLMGWLVNWWLDTRGKRAPITGAGGDQLNNIVWPEILAANRRKPLWLASQYESVAGELRYRVAPENWRAILRTARPDNNDALQGFHDCMFFIDEGSGVRDEIFEVASGALGDPGAFGFMTGNPTRLSGYFFRLFRNGSFWYPMHFSSEDSLAESTYRYTYVNPLGDTEVISTAGRQTMQWVEDMRREYGLKSNVYRVRVLGEFSEVNNDSLIEPSTLEDVRIVECPKMKTGIRRMGVDPAWTGEDDTGVVIREGTTILHVESWNGCDLVESFERIKILFREWQCDYVHVDSIGVGAGLYDMLKHAVYNEQIGYPAISVVVSNAAPEDKDASCRTLRDWLWWKSRQFFRKKSVSFCGRQEDWESLSGELIAPSYKILSGRVVAESKDEMKRRGIRSPNKADALNLTFHQDYETFRESYISQRELSERLNHKKKREVRSWKSR